MRELNMAASLFRGFLRLLPEGKDNAAIFWENTVFRRCQTRRHIRDSGDNDFTG
jgi:hypothetical protein